MGGRLDGPGKARHRADIDDAARGDGQLAEAGVAHAHGADEVHIDHVRERPRPELRPLPQQRAGVVDKDVQAVDAVQRLFDRQIVGHVEAQRGDLAVGRVRFEGVERRRGPRRHRDLGPGARQGAGDGVADPRCPAGHQRRLAGKVDLPSHGQPGRLTGFGGGAPSSTAFMFRAASRTISCRVSTSALAMCDVSTTLSRARSPSLTRGSNS